MKRCQTLAWNHLFIHQNTSSLFFGQVGFRYVDIVFGGRLPDQASLGRIDVDGVIQGHDRSVLEQDLYGGLEDRLALLQIKNLPLLLDQAVEFGIGVRESLGNSALEIFVEEVVGVDHSSPTSEADRTFPGPMQVIENAPLGGMKARFDTDLGELSGYRLGDFAVLRVPTCR